MVKRFEDIYAEIIQQLIEAGASVQVEVVIHRHHRGCRRISSGLYWRRRGASR